MTERILCVDDDSNILVGYQRALRKRFAIEIALGGEEGLTAVREQGPYAVIVADMRMPGMNGVELLSRVRQLAPDTVRIMLTGNSDQQTALDAVNQGQIFRFLTKPCSSEELASSLESGLRQYQLIVAERELLSKTLSGSIKILTDVLSLVSPTAFGRSSRIRSLARRVAESVGEQGGWMIEIAAMLSQVGCVTIPDELLSRMYRGEQVSMRDERAYMDHPQIGRDLIQSVPRLEPVAVIIGYQNKRYDGGGDPQDEPCGEQIPLGARILKCVLDYDTLVMRGAMPAVALAEMLQRTGWYDLRVLNALRDVLNITQPLVIQQVDLLQLRDGMVIAADVRSKQGAVLCTKGQEVTRALRFRLRNYAMNAGLEGSICVFTTLGLDLPRLTDVACSDHAAAWRMT